MVWIQQSKFFNNSAKGASTVNPRYGGAIMLDGATVTLLNIHVCGNIASSTGGKRTSGIGGGLYYKRVSDWCLSTLIWEMRRRDWRRLALDSVHSVEMEDQYLPRIAHRKAEWCHWSTLQVQLKILVLPIRKLVQPQKLMPTEITLGPTSIGTTMLTGMEHLDQLQTYRRT